MPAWFSRLVVALVALAIVGGGALSMLHVATYGNWPWDGDPLRLHWCGRTYERTEPPAVADPREIARRGLFRVLMAPPVVGDEAYAEMSPEEARARDEGGEPCTELLYLRTRSGHLVYSRR